MQNHVKPEQPFRHNDIQQVTVSRKQQLELGFFLCLFVFFHFKANKTGWELGPPKAHFHYTLSQIRI